MPPIAYNNLLMPVEADSPSPRRATRCDADSASVAQESSRTRFIDIGGDPCRVIHENISGDPLFAARLITRTWRGSFVMVAPVQMFSHFTNASLAKSTSEAQLAQFEPQDLEPQLPGI